MKIIWLPLYCGTYFLILLILFRKYCNINNFNYLQVTNGRTDAHDESIKCVINLYLETMET